MVVASAALSGELPPLERRTASTGTECAPTDWGDTWQIFISYAREDHGFAQHLASVLEDHGWSVWWDRDLVPGERFQEVIERELERAAAVVVVWSAVSVRSQWVRSEASYAADREVLIPVLTEPTTVPLRFRIVQAVDVSGWDGSSDEPRLQRLLAGVQTVAGPPSPPDLRLPPPDRKRTSAGRVNGG